MAKRAKGARHDHRRGRACPICDHGHHRERGGSTYVRRGVVHRNGRRYLYAVAVREA